MVAKVVTVDFMHDCTTVNNSGLVSNQHEKGMIFHSETTELIGIIITNLASIS